MRKRLILWHLRAAMRLLGGERVGDAHQLFGAHSLGWWGDTTERDKLRAVYTRLEHALEAYDRA